MCIVVVWINFELELRAEVDDRWLCLGVIFAAFALLVLFGVVVVVVVVVVVRHTECLSVVDSCSQKTSA